MLKITKYASQFDLYILKWPKACMACGSTNLDKISPRYKTIDSRNVRTSGVATIGGETKTTVNTMMKTKLFLCYNCKKEIHTAVKIPSKGSRGHGELAKKLKDGPYDQFVTLGKNGRVWIAEGPYLEMIMELNPELNPLKGKNPLMEMRKKIPKDAVITEGEFDFEDEGVEQSSLDEDSEIQYLKEMIDEEPRNYQSWTNLGMELAVKGRCDEAKDALQQAVGLASDPSEIMDALKVVEEHCKE
ncbi:MAG: tetratricopeptide repeat protein [Candidatus Thorarchaeota archaeon]